MDILQDKIIKKLDIIKLYSSKIGKLSGDLSPLIQQNDDNYVKKIRSGEMDLKSYVEFKKNFMLQQVMVQDYRLHMVGLVSLSSVFEEILVMEGKSLADKFNTDDLLIIEKAKKTEVPSTAAIKNDIVFKDELSEKKVLEVVVGNAPQEFEMYLNGKA